MLLPDSGQVFQPGRCSSLSVRLFLWFFGVSWPDCLPSQVLVCSQFTCWWSSVRSRKHFKHCSAIIRTYPYYPQFSAQIYNSTIPSTMKEIRSIPDKKSSLLYSQTILFRKNSCCLVFCFHSKMKKGRCSNCSITFVIAFSKKIILFSAYLLLKYKQFEGYEKSSQNHIQEIVLLLPSEICLDL